MFKMRWTSSLIVMLFCVSMTKSQTPTELAKQLYTDQLDFMMRTRPESDSYFGFHRYPESLTDYSLEGITAVRSECQQFHDRAKNLIAQSAKNSLSWSDRLDLEIIEKKNELCVKQFGAKIHLLAGVDHLTSIPLYYRDFFGLDNPHKLDSVQDYRNLLNQMQKLPTLFDQVIKLLEMGIKENITFHNASMFRVKSQFDVILDYNVPIEANTFYNYFKRIAQKLGLPESSQDVKQIQAEAKRVIREEVLPAYEKLNNFIQVDYYPHLRKEPGIGSLPNGMEMYKVYLEKYTTKSGLEPSEVHQIGLTEVDESKKKLTKIAENLGYKNLPFREFIQKIREDPKQSFSSIEEALDYSRALLQKANLKLNLLFGPDVLIPEIFSVDVLSTDPFGSHLSYYNVKSERVNASVRLNFNDINRLKKFELLPLILHEGNPGHHLEHVTSKKTNRPQFVKYTGFTAHREGWGLYAETLGHEMNLYDDEDDATFLVGYYSSLILRSARLVVDTGIHAFGWSREKSIQYLVDNTALDEKLCENEIDKYITWPGHATTNKIGERYIRKLRIKLAKEQADKFDLKNYHASVLRCSGMIESLENCVRQNTGYSIPKQVADSKSSASKFSMSVAAILTTIFLL